MTARAVPVIPNFFAGQALTGTLMNQISAVQTFQANPPMFRMKQSVAQSIANATFVQVTCDLNDYDTDSGRSGSTPYSYVIPTGMTGRWRFYWYTPWATNATGGRASGLYRNGSLATPYVVTPASTGGLNNSTFGSETIAVNAGDVMSMWAYQNSGGALSTMVDSFPTYPAFGGQLVSLANP